jgi:hypothetical protein
MLELPTILIDDPVCKVTAPVEVNVRIEVPPIKSMISFTPPPIVRLPDVIVLDAPRSNRVELPGSEYPAPIFNAPPTVISPHV